MRRRHSLLSGLASLLVGLVASVAPGWGADYGGPLIDAHSHLPNATAIDAYVAAMKRHNVLKVVLLGVGGAAEGRYGLADGGEQEVSRSRRRRSAPCPTRRPRAP